MKACRKREGVRDKLREAAALYSIIKAINTGNINLTVTINIIMVAEI